MEEQAPSLHAGLVDGIHFQGHVFLVPNLALTVQWPCPCHWIAVSLHPSCQTRAAVDFRVHIRRLLEGQDFVGLLGLFLVWLDNLLLADGPGSPVPLSSPSSISSQLSALRAVGAFSRLPSAILQCLPMGWLWLCGGHLGNIH